MDRKEYRVEVNHPKDKKPQYFLTKDVRLKGKKTKIKKSIGNSPPTSDELEKYTQQYAFEIELKAAKKKAEMSSELYTARYLSLKEMKTIEELRFLYKTFTDLLTTNEIEAYEQKYEIHYVQGTTAIEGNTFSLKETRDLLVDGISPYGKTLREVNEIQNFKKVRQYRDKYKGKVTVKFIRILHSLIMSNIDEAAGSFRRTDDIGITGCDLRVAPSVMIEEDLQESINEYYSNVAAGKNPFEQAVLFHYNFEIIHPFADGNGRVGREVFNYMLIREGYPRLLFLGSDRREYISALKFGNDDKYKEMILQFATIILFQRGEVLKDNLKNVIQSPKKAGQKRITDYPIK